MVSYHPDLDLIPVEDVLAALGNPVRLFIVRELAASTQPRTCGSLPVSVTKATATHHWRVLRESGVTRERREGRTKVVELRRAELDERFPGLLATILAASPPRASDGPPA
ncbi:ArsR/SmtB family transcription factor [Streptomyces abikoensis]|uniref:ArsR/SmtB family transcription factor n=1 Tax=Streptomyces abikoensis TaxID=97398 RepID=UPI001672971A|nr:helix-turn-helix transcriptional regulator [Streptomyces abikoensis]GGP35872.1 transcriptional regulator [Streptomyces abikoensis]